MTPEKFKKPADDLNILIIGKTDSWLFPNKIKALKKKERLTNDNMLGINENSS